MEKNTYLSEPQEEKLNEFTNRFYFYANTFIKAPLYLEN